MHGFGIARRVEQISRGVFKVNPGSLLTALQRLERAGWLDAEWRQTENSRRAKIYTPHPRRQEAARRRDRGLDAPRVGRRAAPESGGLDRCPSGASSRAAFARSSIDRAADRDVADEVAALSRRGHRGARSRSGLSPEDARRAARLELGSTTARPGASARVRAGRTSSSTLVRRSVAMRARRLRAPSGLRGGQRAHAGARHRRQHGDLQRGQPDPVPAAALPARRPHRDDLGRRQRRLAHRRHVRHVSRARRAEPLVRVDGGDEGRGSRP